MTCKFCEEKERGAANAPIFYSSSLSLPFIKTSTPIKINAHPKKVIVITSFITWSVISAKKEEPLLAHFFVCFIMCLITIIIKPIHIITSPNISINAMPPIPITKIAHILNNSNMSSKTVNNIIIIAPSFHKITCKFRAKKKEPLLGLFFIIHFL